MTLPKVLEELVSHLLETIECDPSVAPKFSRLSDYGDVWRSLLFCILSSQVRTSTAAKATQAVLDEVPFFGTVLSSRDVYEKSKQALLRTRYRFPEARSQQIANSWFAFAQVRDCLYDFLDSFETETKAREAVTQLFPGIGLKQGSMFLRDIGYARRLCIIDTHLLWYCGQMGMSYRGAMTSDKYFEVEEFLLKQSDERGVCPRILDSAIWVAVTTIKARQCTMRFV